MPKVSIDDLKETFSGGVVKGNNFADLIDSCYNESVSGHTGDVIVGTSLFKITNGIITSIEPSGTDGESSETDEATTDTNVAGVNNQGNTLRASEPVIGVSLTIDSKYDGNYIYEDKIFPDNDIVKVYVNNETRNRFVSYIRNGKVYWELVKKGWTGTLDSILTQNSIRTGYKSKAFDEFLDLVYLKGGWEVFFEENSIREDLRSKWYISNVK
jgi:hypothetical protein